MKSLLVLRHAKSSWNDPTLKDHDRPLNKRGKRDAPRMGDLLADEQLLPDLIVSSTAARARTTADTVAASADYTGDVLYTEDLYHAGFGQFVRVLSALDDRYERVMVVAHNPGIEDLVERLGRRYARMPTAALAWIELDVASWADLGDDTVGRLVSVWRPKEL